MAKKTEAKILERTYTVHLRREFRKVPIYQRTPKAIKALRQFLAKHMKSENISLGKKLNLELWKHGIRNPPGKVKVTVTKEDDKVKAELFGHALEEKVATVKPSVEDTVKEKALPEMKEESLEEKKVEAVEQEIKEEVKEELKEAGMKEEVAEKVAEEVKEESEDVAKEVVAEQAEAKEPQAEEPVIEEKSQ